MIGILVDEYGDMRVENSAMVTGNADEQIAQGVIVANHGDFKETPKLGMEVINILGGSPDEFFVGRLKSQLISQHLKLKRISIDDQEINIEL